MLTPIEGQLLIAGISIGVGLYIEKWCVSRTSILINVFTWLVLLFTIDIPDWLLAGMAVWLFVGFLLTKEKGKDKIKQFFGSKVFGSLALVLGLIEYFDLQLSGIGLLIGWAIIVVIVVLMGERIKKRSKGWK